MDLYDIKVYFNPFYQAYGCSCYMIYINSFGAYLVTDKKVNMINDQIRFSLNSKESESYASCRGFDKVVFMNSETNDTIWYNQYSDRENMNKLNRAISKARSAVAQQYKYNINSHEQTYTIYMALNKLIILK